LTERLDVDRQAAKRRPVAPRIFEQRLVLRNPDMAAFAAHPAVENDARDLAALPGPGAIAEEIAHAVDMTFADALSEQPLSSGSNRPGRSRA
jgi:hypothetical protein